MRILLSLLVAVGLYGQERFSPPPGLRNGDVLAFYRPVAGAPFSADITVQSGSQPPSSGKIFRDSEGRTRLELLAPLIHINDPVAQKGYMLYPARKTFLTSPQFTNVPSTGESLGSRTIEGLTCEGVRTGDREIWTSKDLQIPLLVTGNEPGTGELTMKVTNIKRETPAAEQFRVPPDFVSQDSAEVSAPTVISRVPPEYSKEALDAKLEGSVMLSIVIGTDGVAREIKVIRALGLGLDEKAIEAVSKWRFKPGMKGSTPVAVRANVEVTFRLLKDPPKPGN